MPAGLTENRSILNKADLQLSHLQSDGGYLVPEQSAKFMRLLILRSVVMGWATVDPMKTPQKEINKIRFAQRVLQSGEPGQALQLPDRSKPDLSKVTLESKLFKAEVRLNNETLEDSIEQGSLKNTVMQEMSKAIARDMEDVVINGDTTSPSPFYAKLDGVLRQAQSNIVNASGVRLHRGILRDLQKAMPSEFIWNKRDLAYLTSIDAEIDYRDSLADRATAEGDRALGSSATSDAAVGYTGIPVRSVPLFPENQGNPPSHTSVLFLDPKNIYVGVQRQIRMETDKDISAGEIIIVVTLRFDVKYAEETAVCKAENVLVG